MLARTPGHNAMVFVAFALIGAMPTNSSVGKLKNDPPPATALSAPAAAAASNRMPYWKNVTISLSR
jgi:hypothetical protein